MEFLRSVSTISLLFFSLTAVFCSFVTAFDAYDPTGNITLRWDVLSWTPDGYVAVVNVTNYQLYRAVTKPGWKIGWTWAGREVIWTTIGAQPVSAGDCSRFKGSIPTSCVKRPTIVDLTAGVPYNQQISGCCRGGTLLSRSQDLRGSTAGFQISVGASGTTNSTVQLPKNFTLVAGNGGDGGRGYTCGPAKVVAPTRFITADGRRVTQALMTWKVVCTYSAFVASKRPTCCVSVGSSDHRINATCPTCSCSCRNQTCNNSLAQQVKCSDHMCPTSIKWQMLPKDKKGHLGVRVSITNLNYKVNYSDWTMLVDHPAINHLTTVAHANHKKLPSKTIEVVWGMKKKNTVIRTSGVQGSTLSWAMNFKGIKNYTRYGCSRGDWCAPKAIMFNGNRCVMPSQPKRN